MGNNRGGVGTSSKYKPSLTAKFFKRPPSHFSISLYIILTFAFSVFIFIIYIKDTIDDEHTPSVPQDSHSKQFPDDKLWEVPFKTGLHPCVKPTAKYKVAQGGDRYISVRSNGGLNQMRTGISDMVAVARMMNATLVIPQLDRRSFWQDTSTFSDIFDETHFITSLQEDVKIVKELPKELQSVPRARKHFTSWSGMGYYEEVAQLFKDYQIIHVPKSDSRVANNDLPVDIQKLRCRALYQALRFSPPIESLGKV